MAKKRARTIPRVKPSKKHYNPAIDRAFDKPLNLRRERKKK